MGLALTSPAFAPGGEIPARFTCEGRDLSPALDWTGVPETARSLVLIVDDPDAPDPKAPKMTWVHWVLYDLPPSVPGLPEGVAAKDLPPGTKQGTNDWKRTATAGPVRRSAGTATSTSSTPSTSRCPISARRPRPRSRPP
jgi:hypothetical protein